MGFLNNFGWGVLVAIAICAAPFLNQLAKQMFAEAPKTVQAAPTIGPTRYEVEILSEDIQYAVEGLDEIEAVIDRQNNSLEALRSELDALLAKAGVRQGSSAN